MYSSGYDKTNWRSTFAQVKKLYPGGTKQASRKGEEYYSVRRKVASFDAGIAFMFREGHLDWVSVKFRRPGSPVRFNLPPTNDVASQIFDVVRDGLESKYGKPAFDRARSDVGVLNPKVQAVWITPDGDTMIALMFDPQPDGTHTGVGMYYAERD